MIIVHSAKKMGLTETDFQKLYSIIIKAYADTEDQMWGQNYVRVPEYLFREYVEKDQVLAAFMNGEVVGGLRYYETEPGIFSFGLFGADFSKSRMGIGRALIERVEAEAQKKQARQIRIEILRPRNFEIPIKTILAHWYQRLGYMYTGTTEFEVEFPERAKGILVPCNFDYYTKEL
jgi:GNAT superfamily N-acetyltransferase